jgi:hypothetical protein
LLVCLPALSLHAAAGDTSGPARHARGTRP